MRPPPILASSAPLRRIGAALLVALAAARGASAQEQGTWQVLAEEMELRELVEFCADALGVAIDYRREDLEGRVVVRSGPGVTAEGLWATTNRRLAAAGFACVQPAGEDSLSIVPLAQAAQLARIEADPETAIAGYIRVVRRLEASEPETVVEALKALLPKDGSLVVSPAGSGHLFVAGLTPQVVQAFTLIDALDAAPPRTVVEEVALAHLPPVAMVSLLEQVAQKRKGVDKAGLLGSAIANPAAESVLLVAPEGELPVWRELITRFDRGETWLTRNYVPRRFGLQETAALLREAIPAQDEAAGSAGPWRLVVDELTGTLIVSAPYGVHQAIDELLERLEATGPNARRALRSFPVEHRDVDELLGLLQDLLEEGAVASVGAIAAAAAEPAIDEATSAARNAPLRLEELEGEELTLSADTGTNRIVAFGSVRLLGELGELIAALDQQHPQVVIEALVVGLSESELRDLGVELRAAGVSDDVLGEVSSLFGLGSPILSSGAIPPATGSGATGVLLDPGDFSGVVRALEVVNDGRTLTVPKILVANHEAASLNSVLQQPFTSTNASNTVATTSLGGTQDAGTTIVVTPHITSGDRLRVDYQVSISNFVGESSDPNLPPPRQENALDSTVTVPDGYTVVVGGLDIESDSEATSKVPGLGDLPFLGTLFRSTSANRSKTRFFVFLRCTILRRTDYRDLRYLSVADRETAGVEDLPVLEPRLIR